MDILDELGIVFENGEAIDLFKKHGFRTDGNTVFFKEKDVLKYIEKVPSQFNVTARNEEKSLQIGESKHAFAPGYGAPFIIANDGERRVSTLADYINFSKLVQTSKFIDLNGYLIVQPAFKRPEIAHLDMMLATTTYCDKPFIGCSESKRTASDTIRMVNILWGGGDKIKNQPVMIGNYSGNSPLIFSKDMIGGLIEFAKYGQPCAIKASGMRGATMPIKLHSSIVVQNAMILAATVLVQLVNPGTPVLYGGLPYPFNMRLGESEIGLPDVSIGIFATAQMAGFYNLPSIEISSVTDSHVPDAQAGIESTLTLYSCLISGVNLIFCSCGILSSYLAMSYEKFIIDEELCGMIKCLSKTEKVTDKSIDLAEIKNVGIGGEYLSSNNTLKFFKTAFYQPGLMHQNNYEKWRQSGKKNIDQVASEIVHKRLDEFKAPDIPPDIDADLNKFVETRKNHRE